MRTARIVRRRPRRSSACADCAAGFIIARTAIIRYPRRRRTRTAKRAEFELASSTYSVLNRTRRVHAAPADLHETCDAIYDTVRVTMPDAQHPGAGLLKPNVFKSP